MENKGAMEYNSGLELRCFCWRCHILLCLLVTDMLQGMQSMQMKVAALPLKRWQKGKHEGAFMKDISAPGLCREAFGLFIKKKKAQISMQANNMS